MIYFYKEITPTVRRPIIEIIVKSKYKFAIYPVLIDSGADYCIFSIDLAKEFNIKLQLRDKVNFLGVGGEKITGFLTNIEIKIGDKSYETKVIFADISDFGHGILGQKGFFDHFDVRFKYQKLIIEVEPI